MCMWIIQRKIYCKAFLVGRTAASRAGGASGSCRQHTELESADWPPHIDASKVPVQTNRDFFGDRDGKENTSRVARQGPGPGEPIL